VESTVPPANIADMNARLGLLGTSSAFSNVVRFIHQVAKAEATVLIQGETGTGKEVAARAIHSLSRRRHAPFVAINCAAIPEALFEGELFGYARGAFTGAMRAYAGKLRLADGGTILLDEIGELPPASQSKLLRALETREVFPLGASRSESFNIRIIAASNHDLEQLVKQNRFRADLFFRLNVARVQLPALRERREDIPVLFAHFVCEMSQRAGATLGQLSRATHDALLGYGWPGNIRELRNVVEALFIDPPVGCVEPGDLPANLTCAFNCTPALSERDAIISALEAAKWNKCRAADELHWSRMTLYRKLKKYAINGAAVERASRSV
jgi:transcriptional regulator with PAS, ATPase and Fis domain